MPTGVSGSLTLAQYAIQSNDPLVARVAFSLHEHGSVVQDWPLATKSTLKMNGVRFTGSLPTVNWRKINEASTVTSGTANPYTEQAFIMSNIIDVDRKLVDDENQISDPRGIQLEAYLRSVAYDMNDKFFNNNHVTGDEDAFVGIRARLDDSATWGTNSNCKIDASGVVMTNSLTAASAGQFFENLDRALDEIGSPNGDGCVIYMNRLLRRRASRAIKVMGAGGGFDMTDDAFDRRVETYRNARLRTVGVKSDQSTEIITNTEDATGADGASTFTSLYVVKYGEGYVQPWQMAPMRVEDIGVRTDEPTHYRLLVDWACGYVQNHTRAVARVYDIKVS